eukprot:306836-Hanusia_phi.AAC.2
MLVSSATERKLCLPHGTPASNSLQHGRARAFRCSHGLYIPIRGGGVSVVRLRGGVVTWGGWGKRRRIRVGSRFGYASVTASTMTRSSLDPYPCHEIWLGVARAQPWCGGGGEAGALKWWPVVPSRTTVPAAAEYLATQLALI